MTALWAVLTRMKKPLAEKYGKTLSDMVVKLGPLEKALLYADTLTPEGLSTEQQRELVAGIEKIARESDSYPNYEGRTGASPREMKLIIMNAAQSAKYQCLSPFAVFDELEELVRGVTVYEFLKQEPLPGGFHENRKFIFQVRDRLIDASTTRCGRRWGWSRSAATSNASSATWRTCRTGSSTRRCRTRSPAATRSPTRT